MHDEALTKEGLALVSGLSKFSDFYLVGGTCLALQIGHRISVDFDLFTQDNLPEQLLARVKRTFKDASLVVTYKSSEQLNLLINDVKVTFFHFPYPVVEDFLDYKGLKLVTIKEIAAMKAFAIGQRLSYKDYTDWYFMLNEGLIDITSILELAKQKFGTEFNDRLFLGQLVTMDDIKEQRIDFLRGEVSKEIIQSFLINEVKKLRL